LQPASAHCRTRGRRSYPSTSPTRPRTIACTLHSFAGESSSTLGMHPVVPRRRTEVPAVPRAVEAMPADADGRNEQQRRPRRQREDWRCSTDELDEAQAAHDEARSAVSVVVETHSLAPILQRPRSGRTHQPSLPAEDGGAASASTPRSAAVRHYRKGRRRSSRRASAPRTGTSAALS